MSGECTCCPPGKRPAIEHARGCPRRARRTVPLTTLSVGDQLGPAAGDTRTDRERVREAVERTIHAGIVRQWHGSMRDDVALTDPRPIVRDLLAIPEVAALLDAAEKVRRVEAALTAEEAYTREVGGYVKVPKSEYGPSEWRLHGDARGRRLVLAEIRRALNGDAS